MLQVNLTVGEKRAKLPWSRPLCGGGKTRDFPPSVESLPYLLTTCWGREEVASSTVRPADQTLAAFFWNATSSSYAWNTVAVSLAARRHTSLSEHARLLALLNVTMADAMMSCDDAKYAYEFWRSVTAIPLAADDGNPATIEDPHWAPLLATPPVPEFPSGHSCASGAAAALLADYFGEDTHFTVGSDVMVGVIRSFRSFSQAREEVKNARIFGGIHFRTACDVGQKLGRAVAAYVRQHVVSK